MKIISDASTCYSPYISKSRHYIEGTAETICTIKTWISQGEGTKRKREGKSTGQREKKAVKSISKYSHVSILYTHAIHTYICIYC